MEAAMRAAADVGRPVLDRIDVLATPGILMIPRDNPATRVAEAIGIKPRRRISCPVGGNTPQYLVEVLGAEIAVGRADCVLVVGAESGHSARNVNGRKAIAAPSPCEARDEALGDARPGLSDVETSAGLRWPHEVYPMFESAIAARHGRDFSTQRDWLGALMAPFTQEAARHPEQAWFAQARTASELSDVRPNNRMVCEPYPKLLNSIITVDMGAAFLMVAAEVADKLGVPRDRWVFPWAAASCNDVFYPVQRPDLSRSPGIRAAARHVLARSGVAVDDLTWLDLYSCFPSAVQIAIDELDLDPADARGFTVTRGAALPRGSGKQLRHPLHRGDGSAVPTPTAGTWIDQRARLVHD
ncbi:hypothetical protein M1248_15220 [Mycobacterium sp. 29Ha]|nr:hypothetical protein [Mycobacterium sp. 29Ha]